MRFKGKKPIASYKDTWCVDNTLRPIIAEALRKFLEVKNNPKHSDYFGVPGNAFSKELESQDIEVRSKEWDKILHKMYWAFSTPEPDMEDYDFTIELVPANASEDSRFRTKVTNQEEYDRFEKDETEYWTKRQEGYELFGKYLHNIWW